jgi:NAD(P)-dependent dehydrogenase (short-subunit alcohol dehydrogenase family)
VKEMKQERNIFDLSGKVALVTGGGNGLGRFFCEALAEFGADVSVVDIDERGAKEAAGSVKGLGRRSMAVRVDINSPDDVERMATQTVAELGRIDILVNNAGVTAKPARVAEIAVEDWDRVMGINLRGAFLCTKAVLPVMVRQGSGSIINIASTKGIRSLIEVDRVMPIPSYSVSKAGLIMLTKETAVEYAMDGIRANCIAAGRHAGTGLSSQHKKDWDEDRRRRYEEAVSHVTAMGRSGQVSEFKGVLVFLASDASSYMTGQVLASDGGTNV